MSGKRPYCVRVALPVPMRREFDFIWPADFSEPVVGSRVRVPFGRRTLIGIVTEAQVEPLVALEKLRPAKEQIDQISVFSPALWQSLRWATSYYQAPPGEMLMAALPKKLREGRSLQPGGERWFFVKDADAMDSLRRAPRQAGLYQYLLDAQNSTAGGLSETGLDQQEQGWRVPMKHLEEKGLVYSEQRVQPPAGNPEAGSVIELNSSQADARHRISKGLKDFECFLLHGTTGSGKTEVYFDAMDKVLADGGQVLMLVPEIGLTPQLMERVQNRFEYPVACLHSAMTDNARHLAWWQIRETQARIVVGTRSAIFAPFSNLGLIVVDEEHDTSFKQQDGVRYHARDLAIYLARTAGVGIVLGSATPSFESLLNCQRERYQYVSLEQRAAGSELPDVSILDMRRAPVENGLSLQLIEAIKARLERGEQSLLFLNRRGFAPVLYCGACGQGARCHRCDAFLTYHKSKDQVRCHHCGYQGRYDDVCRECDTAGLSPVGEGTQQVEQALGDRFPEARVLRIDRDSAARGEDLPRMLEMARSGQADIILGTQLLTKGHDFPGVTLVAILNADQGLFSSDFRGSEHLFQQLVQVAGRSGRRTVKGQVLIQTAVPEHPFFVHVREHDYNGFSEQQLDERRVLSYPPYEQAVMFRAEASKTGEGLNFLARVRSMLVDKTADIPVRIYEPVPSPMERRAGRYRAQLMVLSKDRVGLSRVLADCITALEEMPVARKVRWSVDVDPADTY